MLDKFFGKKDTVKDDLPLSGKGQPILYGEPENPMPQVPWPPENPEFYAIMPYSVNSEVGSAIHGWQRPIKGNSEEERLFEKRQNEYFKNLEKNSDEKLNVLKLGPMGADPLDRFIPPRPVHIISSEFIPQKGYFRKTLPDRSWHDTTVQISEHQFARLVSEEWKEAIESVEPGLHQFFPYEIICDDGRRYKKFIFYVRSRVESINYEASGFYRQINRYTEEWWWNDSYHYADSEDKKYVLLTDKVKGLHFWRDTRKNIDFISAELAEKLGPHMNKWYRPFAVGLTPSDWESGFKHD